MKNKKNTEPLHVRSLVEEIKKMKSLENGLNILTDLKKELFPEVK